MKERFIEEQIIGFLKEVEARMPVELCRRHVFSTPRTIRWINQDSTSPCS